MSVHTRLSSSIPKTKISLEIDNDDDNEFEEFEEENWTPPNNKQDLWDSTWDEVDTIDEDLAKFINKTWSQFCLFV